jgi:hypothetical protein
MRHLSKSILTLAAVAALSALSAPCAYAQKADVTAETPVFEPLPSPEFSGGKQKSSKPKDWLEIETKIKVSMSPEPKSKTCEKLTMKWYIAIKNPEKSGTMWLLEKSVEHVNVPLEEEVYCSVYISPASLRRMGFDRGSKGAVECVGFEALVNGEKVATKTTKWKDGWWNMASEKISRNDSIQVLDKSETPFSMMWWDRYAEVAKRRD